MAKDNPVAASQQQASSSASPPGLAAVAAVLGAAARLDGQQRAALDLRAVHDNVGKSGAGNRDKMDGSGQRKGDQWAQEQRTSAC